MRIEEKGIVITFGTSDAPAPKGEIQATNPIPAMACVEPTDGSAAAGKVSLRLVYRINGGPAQSAETERLWKSSGRKGWYYRAYIPPRNPGERVDYTFCLYSAGDNPVFNDGMTFGSFVVAPGTLEPESSSSDGLEKPKAAHAQLKIRGNAAIGPQVAPLHQPQPGESPVLTPSAPSAVAPTASKSRQANGDPTALRASQDHQESADAAPKVRFASHWLPGRTITLQL